MEYSKDMMESFETLYSKVIQLTPDQRLTLAHKILGSVEAERSAYTDAEWDQEIRARIARYDASEVQGIPASEVFAELDRRLGR